MDFIPIKEVELGRPYLYLSSTESYVVKSDRFTQEYVVIGEVELIRRWVDLDNKEHVKIKWLCNNKFYKWGCSTNDPIWTYGQMWALKIIV